MATAVFIGRTSNAICVKCGKTRLFMREYRIFEIGKRAQDVVACNQEHVDQWLQKRQREKLIEAHK